MNWNLIGGGFIVGNVIGGLMTAFSLLTVFAILATVSFLLVYNYLGRRSTTRV